MKIQCMIVDDEPHAIKILESYVKQIDQLEVRISCENAIDAYDFLRKQKIDLIFLDVKMPVITGVEFLRSLLNPPKVIFTTAYRDFAIDGFELDIVDYLLKPISFDRFLKAIGKVNRQLMVALEPGKTEILNQYLVNKESFLYFKIEKSMKKVLLEDITYVESAKDYAKLFLMNGKSLLVKQSISSMENMLSSHRFVRIHRSFIVAVNKISSFTSSQIIAGKSNLPIGRLYKTQVLQLLQNGKNSIV